jgi:hypothetical protein
MNLFATLLLACFTGLAYCQTTLNQTVALSGTEWSEGIITLNNGHRLKGLLRYNARLEVLSYENGKDSKTFTARQLVSFQLMDDHTQKKRLFYSLPYEDSRNGLERHLFFEVLMELPEFSLISKIAPLRMDKREYTTPAMFNPIAGSFSGGKYYGYPTTFSYTETILIMSKSGKITPYLEVIEKDIDGVFFDRTRKKQRILNREVLRAFTKPYYSQLMQFARENSLNLKDKTGLLGVLERYKTITE